MSGWHNFGWILALEVGDRSLGDAVIYPDDDLKAVLMDGQWTSM